ncbi:UDP-galactopyranose mutase [Alishewanella tabrizica]|uniref:UDP-galactopyranose mutase n=1 Tax=Alishewanella tabrizica TaxID=671278 RepID=A0ABQ2WM44_9ALTE|nr:UDP-galactopyranose mutase [Alishewanella tabrizica]GGW63443.1 UDP-galactopyranose mutase [Alishewanella tabrizica]
MDDFKAIVIGAGLSGAVMAERIACVLGWKVLVLEQRSHIAGNCFDQKNDQGITVHQYGPHLFHTSRPEVWEYLSRFTDWHPYQHKVLAEVAGKLIPLPFNLNSLHLVYPAEQAIALEAKLVALYGAGNKVSITKLRETEDPELAQLADWIYNNIFVNYTMRQWGIKAEEIAPEVLARVPVVLSRDDRYFHDNYQAIPAAGYTALISRLLSHQNINVQLLQNALQRIKLEQGQIWLDGELFNGKLIYTGMLDQLFAYQFGELPYRSLKFLFRQLDCPYFQTATTVNYPNAPDFTRITEFKHILAEPSDSTTIVTEYPQDYDKNDPQRNIPYYPVFTGDNQQRFEKYKALSAQYPQLTPLGRLAEYKYFNMDDAVANALQSFTELQKNCV